MIEVTEISNHIDLILVTYNCSHFLPEFFSMLKKTADIPFQLLVIDNASTDNTRSYLTGLKFKDPIRNRMKLIFNPKNIGVAKAWNQGIGLSKGNYQVFLNPDIKFTSGWLRQMIQCAENHPDSGVVGAKILNFNHIIDHAGFLNGVVRGRGETEDAKNYDQEIEVDDIHGCCFLVKRQILNKVGNFDERFFLYAEEVDFCLRVKKAGFSVFYCPAAIYHYGAGSQIHFSKRTALYQKSLKKFLEKWNSN